MLKTQMLASRAANTKRNRKVDLTTFTIKLKTFGNSKNTVYHNILIENVTINSHPHKNLKDVNLRRHYFEMSLQKTKSNDMFTTNDTGTSIIEKVGIFHDCTPIQRS